MPRPEIDLHVGRHFSVNWVFEHDQDAASFVYQVFSPGLHGFADEHPIYVGITDRFSARWSAHLGKSHWAKTADILCVILSGYPTRGDARRAEASLIAEHAPVFNVKPERRHLALAQRIGVAPCSVAAELTPTGWRNRHAA